MCSIKFMSLIENIDVVSNHDLYTRDGQELSRVETRSGRN